MADLGQSTGDNDAVKTFQYPGDMLVVAFDKGIHAAAYPSVGVGGLNHGLGAGGHKLADVHSLEEWNRKPNPRGDSMPGAPELSRRSPGTEAP
ncbi:MAG: hypothetical protein MN733_05580 [Nitrososphaera sp.]|nr:hypothetical protein [Nitrososphaera sp.]